MAHPVTEIVLVRHGETDWNKERRLQGQLQPGPPLNALGTKQAEVTATVLPQRFSSFDAIISSDVLRAIQTANILAAPYAMQVRAGGHPD
jgi:probable phosphoglycerate mutase